MKTVAIMQARTVSTRLQGKALLPVAGYPSAVLAALRAGDQRTRFWLPRLAILRMTR